MGAIYKKELQSYVTSPVGYVVAAVLFALYGFYYYSVMLSGSTYYISTFVYSNMFIWSMMLLPILTMRVFSEEQKNRTDQALLTAPVGVGSIVVGKFLAAATVYAAILVGSLIPAVVIGFFSSPNWVLILGTDSGDWHLCLCSYAKPDRGRDRHLRDFHSVGGNRSVDRDYQQRSSGQDLELVVLQQPVYPLYYGDL